MDRVEFASLLSPELKVFELSPFTAPVVAGKNVSYADILDTKKLIARAEEIGLDPSLVVPVDFLIDTTGKLNLNEKFDAIVSAHVLEQQVNLIRHLEGVYEALNDGGRYMLVLPDKRYCFDHFMSESTVAQVIEAHRKNISSHTLQSVIEHKALTTHNDAVRHWRGDHGDIEFELATRVDLAVSEFDGASGGYIDVHAWYFTPDSLASIIRVTFELGLHSFRVERIFSTVENDLEFFMILRK